MGGGGGYSHKWQIRNLAKSLDKYFFRLINNKINGNVFTPKMRTNDFFLTHPCTPLTVKMCYYLCISISINCKWGQFFYLRDLHRGGGERGIHTNGKL